MCVYICVCVYVCVCVCVCIFSPKFPNSHKKEGVGGKSSIQEIGRLEEAEEERPQSVNMGKLCPTSLMRPQKLQTPVCSFYKIVDWFEKIREGWDILSGLV